jgi:type I pantothenate kinase
MASDIPELLETLRERFVASKAHGRFVAAVTGSVAAGKSTFAEELRVAMSGWREKPRVAVAPTDGFLFSNAVLAERGLSYRKGFPESYDVGLLRRTVSEIKRGEESRIPLYSHVTYDVDPANALAVRDADIVVLDGLHLGRIKAGDAGRLIDALVYLDAEETDIEIWFRARLIPLMQAGRTDPTSFYYSFRTLDDAGIAAFTDRVWREINLPNLRNHIVHDRAAADFIVRKRRDHSVERVESR